jgi:hypothetical protein
MVYIFEILLSVANICVKLLKLASVSNLLLSFILNKNQVYSLPLISIAIKLHLGKPSRVFNPQPVRYKIYNPFSFYKTLQISGVKLGIFIPDKSN